MNQLGQQMIMTGLQSLLSGSNQKTPEQLEAERQQEEAARQRKLQLEAEAKARADAQHQSLAQQLKLSGEQLPTSEIKRGDILARAPAPLPSSKSNDDRNNEKNSDFRSKQTCTFSDDGRARPDEHQAVCAVVTCGGTNMTPVCCPPDHPILNECDCNCYRTSESLNCDIGYANCRYTYVPNK